MDDTQKRAKDLNADQRIAELLAENVRMRASLEFHYSELEAALIPVGRLSRSLREVHRLRVMQETMRQHAGADIELAEALAAKNKELVELSQKLMQERESNADLRVKLIAEKRELEFWVEESDRYRNQVVELLRELAVEQTEREVSS